MMTFKVGDLVWAKMKGFPPWPGLVSHPPDGLMEKSPVRKDVKFSCVYFFATHDYGFIENSQLKPYWEHKNILSKKSKSAKFKQACLEIEEHYNKNELVTKMRENNSEGIEAEAKTSVIGGEGIGFLYPTIKLEKLHGIEDFLPIPDIPKRDNSVIKRVLTSPKKISKKRKLSNFSDPDTTTPPDAICQSSFKTSLEQLSKEEPSIHSSDEHSAGDEDEEEEEENEESNVNQNNSVEATDISEEIVSYKIGFIGVGEMGRTLIHRLLKEKNKLIIWNRSPDKLAEFLHLDEIKIATSPAEVVLSSSIIFCCVSNGKAAKDVMFSQGGAILFLNAEKSFVDLSSSDVESSLDLSEAVYSKGSRYLEVRLHGSKTEANEGSLIAISAGDESLHNDCQFFYQSCCKKTFFMGEIGNASKFHLMMQSVAGVALAGLAECMALAERAGLDLNMLLNILKISQINCPLIVENATSMVSNDYTAKMALKNLQNDMQSAIAVGEEVEQPTPVTATANEIFKHAKKVGYGGHDVSAVYLASKF